jgi:putative ATPase
VGLAYPLAAAVTRACVESAKELGMPEARLTLANAAIMLATAPKSNSAHNAVLAATADVQAGLGITPPTHLQSPLYKGYKYPHDYENHYVAQQYLPKELVGRRYYDFGKNRQETASEQYWSTIKNEKKKP